MGSPARSGQSEALRIAYQVRLTMVSSASPGTWTPRAAQTRLAAALRRSPGSRWTVAICIRMCRYGRLALALQWQRVEGVCRQDHALLICSAATTFPCMPHRSTMHGSRALGGATAAAVVFAARGPTKMWVLQYETCAPDVGVVGMTRTRHDEV